jgi:hypothetical protein
LNKAGSNDYLALETDSLKAEVYGNHKFKIEQEKMDAHHRFSTRTGGVEAVSYSITAIY